MSCPPPRCLRLAPDSSAAPSHGQYGTTGGRARVIEARRRRRARDHEPRRITHFICFSNRLLAPLQNRSSVNHLPSRDETQPHQGPGPFQTGEARAQAGFNGIPPKTEAHGFEVRRPPPPPLLEDRPSSADGVNGMKSPGIQMGLRAMHEAALEQRRPGRRMRRDSSRPSLGTVGSPRSLGGGKTAQTRAEFLIRRGVNPPASPSP
ncbi:hypothetical protein AAFF_G00394460 [Aldrovandia affinis]|uniref:Uncharacterized protein n=1 Tax=Aldrovandia affinis TaxID=143900 RepID=A0AAD7WKX0_9TELE|nr:hypothetical protein AAFF_G00394460 [Aldrovandia affinis]